MGNTKTKEQLIHFCHQMAGKSLSEVAKEHHIQLPKELKNAKGLIGQIIEIYLGASGSSLAVQDFPELGIELKTIPINERLEPKESTYVCTAPLNSKFMTWEESWVCRKLSEVLWVPVQAFSDIPIHSRIIGTPILWKPSKKDSQILKQDWEELNELLMTGNIDKLSAHKGVYLQIRPKAANSKQLINYYNTNCELSKTVPKGFYLRTIFTKKILQHNYLSS